MKKKSLYIFTVLLGLTMFFGCSTQKNTKMSRNYQYITTRFNVLFNGKESFDEGIKSIDKANVDDYSQVINMFPYSNHKNLSSAKSNMDRSIEKCRKAIKLHSIKKKPQKNYKKWKDPKYRAWYEQNEFNPALKQTWIMLAQSEFYQGDFLGSVGTFSYIIKHFATVPDVVAEAEIWTARAYIEMDWMYEAEDLLKKLSLDKLNRNNTTRFSATMADFLIKKKQYNEAIPYLKIAIDGEKNGQLKTRFTYVLAQLYSLTNNKQSAAESYSDVIKANPPYIMQLNAELNRARLQSSSFEKTEKKLNGMAKSTKNKDYLDQIYGTLGDISMNEKDTAKAIRYYSQAIEKSTLSGIEKGVYLVKLGDLYYQKKNFIKAEPNYNEASKILTNTYFDYDRVNKRAEVLADLVKEDKVVVLQDSLLKQANMSESDRMAAIQREIDKVKKEEKEAAQKAEIARSNNNMNGNNDNFLMTPNNKIGSNSGNNWYFYNDRTVQSGKKDFVRKWGNRQLEDNWQRANKSASLMANNNENATTEQPAEPNESIKDNNGKAGIIDKTVDNKSTEYYIKQIPFTAEQKQIANKQISDALYNMGFIFKDKMEDLPLSIETFDDFEKRYYTDDRVLETLYQRYIMALQMDNSILAQQYRQEILNHYPGSNYAQALADPNFVAHMTAMYNEQDSIYTQTYDAYTKSNFVTVFKNTKYIKDKYPTSSLLPKFEFLNSLSIGKTKSEAQFQESLDSLISHYPDADVSSMAKGILALIKQGKTPQHGDTHGSLLAKREEEFKQDEEVKGSKTFSDDKSGLHRLMFVAQMADSTLNKVLYNTAIFNFSRFMIKDFDFEKGIIKGDTTALSVTNLASFDEAVWYEKTLRSDSTMNHLIDSLHITLVPISEDNFIKLKNFYSLSEYLAFEKEDLLSDKNKKQLAQAATTKTEKTISEKQKTTEKAEKPAEKEQPLANNTPTTKEEKATATSEKVAATTETAKQPETATTTTEEKTVVATPEPTPEPEEKVEWYKDTYAYRPNAPHYVMLYVPNGSVENFTKIMMAFDKFNSANYGLLNLKTYLETLGKSQAIIIGKFVDANTAKSYFLRMLSDPGIKEATSNLNKRNLVGTQENLNIMVQKDDLKTYFEFMREYYLK